MNPSQALPLSCNISQKNIFFAILQIIGASLFLALSAQISIPLYFSPVPLTTQTFAVMLIGITLGSRKGLLSVLAYLAEGCLGLPVFSGRSFGALYLFGPTGGYLIGLLFQVYLTGWVTEKQKSFQSAKILTTLLLSCLVQLGLGTLWLSHFVGISASLTMGFYPFIMGEILKATGITTYFQKFHKKNPAL